MTQLTPGVLSEAFETEEILHKTATQIANDIDAHKYDVSYLVETLGFALTSPNVEIRVKGTKLLSRTLAQMPKDALDRIQLKLLAEFYADRLKDQHNLMPPIIDGIDALVTMEQLPRECVPKILQSFFQQTSCQSQMRDDRAKLFKIFKCLAERFEPELKSMSGDFIYGLINSIDGERDPRNLDYIFSFMPHFIARYPLLHLSEEMFEIFACYFPIDFNPSKNDPESITRDSLANKLADCLVASSDFLEWTVALVLEKLESDLVVAKLDSLEVLQRAALKFSPQFLQPHFEEIWLALKRETFPGNDNPDVIRAGLKTLSAILEGASNEPTLSHSYQTTVLGVILTHLIDVNHRLFNPSAAIALVCISGDASFATERILNALLLKLQVKGEDSINDDQRIQIYIKLAEVFKIAALRNSLTLPNMSSVCTLIHEDLINSLRRNDGVSNLDVTRAALSVLNECIPTINELNRAHIYQILVGLLTSETTDVELKLLLEQMGALHPIELQTHCIDICIKNFNTYSNFVQSKIYRNFLPLIKQIAFSQRILNLILNNIFDATSGDVCFLALEALNELLINEAKAFIEELQNSNSLIDKLVSLLQNGKIASLNILEKASEALSNIVKQLPIAEQYVIATEYLPKLKLQLECDLYIAKGLLGFLHPDLSLDDHFERLVDDLTQLSLSSKNTKLRQAAHHLLCSIVNKADENEQNSNIIKNLIKKLKQELKCGKERAVEVLSWLGKALIVRGNNEAGEIMETIAELLDHPKFSTAAQLAFEIISAEGYTQLHLPIVQVLYKQKYFHILLSKMGHRLESYCDHHLNAFIYVMEATPHTILKLNLDRIGPILFKCLELNRKRTLCIALKICAQFIQQRDEYFQSHLNHIIPCCVRLSQYKESMQVRIDSLHLLNDIAKYPTYVLLPFRMDVVLELAHAVDDPKRLVRNAAVEARNSWFLVGAPSSEE